MIHTGIVQYLSEIDTNIFLSFNGIHSPFWDYFMSSFTGKFIWIPMYATILYILLKNFHHFAANFPWKYRTWKMRSLVWKHVFRTISQKLKILRMLL